MMRGGAAIVPGRLDIKTAIPVHYVDRRDALAFVEHVKEETLGAEVVKRAHIVLS